ncbi:DUF6415 family natural product biosynthesis protein [Streptomyces bambusae]|uniref:DUF6415 family natural product biosynthesis protein n=1 Tax=Streptomyces bambusae TaxID=1550616 RepID=UPI001CFD4B8F|nr:DUF6415 family natural product biosynthesis protein [Streptomyces bambusae]MCB5163878.1 DUF6415 family natural product biosynthesis protein [Streptomyces bambusae]
MCTQNDPHSAEELIERALVSYELMPSAEVIAGITDGLITQGRGLVPVVEGMRKEDRRIEGAVRDWERLVVGGPADHPLGNWSHCRGLARVVRTMLRATRGELPPYVPTAVSDLPMMSFSRWPTP